MFSHAYSCANRVPLTQEREVSNVTMGLILRTTLAMDSTAANLPSPIRRGGVRGGAFSYLPRRSERNHSVELAARAAIDAKIPQESLQQSLSRSRGDPPTQPTAED